MSQTPNVPSRNPADDGHLAGLLNIAFRKKMQLTDNQLPAQVISYNRANNTAMVLPLIDMMLVNGKNQKRATVASVPVLSLGGGGFCVNFPLQSGDLGWIEASDRDISLFMQSLKESKPNTARIHSFEDGLFIPDAFRKYTFSGADAANMVIQSYDGTVKIALGPGVINLDAPMVNINASNMNFSGSGAATFGIPVTMNQPVTMTDGLKLNGEKVEDHYHSNVQNGSGNTSNMVGGV